MIDIRTITIIPVKIIIPMYRQFVDVTDQKSLNQYHFITSFVADFQSAVWSFCLFGPKRVSFAWAETVETQHKPTNTISQCKTGLCKGIHGVLYNSLRLIRLFSKTVEKNNINFPMVTHLSIVHGLGCLTSVISPLLLAHACIVSQLGILLQRTLQKDKQQQTNKVNCSSNLEMEIYFLIMFTAHLFAPRKHKPKPKAVKVNGQISEVKQRSLISIEMGDHFFSVLLIWLNDLISPRELYKIPIV